MIGEGLVEVDEFGNVMPAPHLNRENSVQRLRE